MPFCPSCLSGGTWYACGTGSKFAGCCNSDPCQQGCPLQDLLPASFNASDYGTFPDQQCKDGSWYTCSATSPPFMGCCRVNACKYPDGCPLDQVCSGYLSNNDAIAQQFYPDPPLASSSNSSTTTQASSTLFPSLAPIVIPSSVADQSSNDSDDAMMSARRVRIAISIALSVTGFCISAIVLWRLYKVRSRRQKEYMASTTQTPPADGVFTFGPSGSHGYGPGPDVQEYYGSAGHQYHDSPSPFGYSPTHFEGLQYGKLSSTAAVSELPTFGQIHEKEGSLPNSPELRPKSWRQSAGAPVSEGWEPSRRQVSVESFGLLDSNHRRTLSPDSGRGLGVRISRSSLASTSPLVRQVDDRDGHENYTIEPVRQPQVAELAAHPEHK